MSELLLLEDSTKNLNDFQKRVSKTQQDIAQCLEGYDFDYNFRLSISISNYLKASISGKNGTIFSDTQLNSFYREYSGDSIYDRFSNFYNLLEDLAKSIGGKIVLPEFCGIFPYHRTLGSMYKLLGKGNILFGDLVLKKKGFDLYHINGEFAVGPITQKTDLLNGLFAYIIFGEYILRNGPISDNYYYSLISIVEQVSLDLTIPGDMLIDSYKYYLSNGLTITEIISRLSNKFMISKLNVSLRFITLGYEINENDPFQDEIIKISLRRKETITSIYGN